MSSSSTSKSKPLSSEQMNTEPNAFTINVNQPITQQPHTLPPTNNCVIIVELPRSPIKMVCPFCSTNIETSTTKKVGAFAYVVSGFLICIGCFCGCCLIPCCVESFQDTDHNCPQCKNFIGRHKII